MVQKCYWLSLLFALIFNTLVGETESLFSECPRHMYPPQKYNHTLSIPKTRISASTPVDNLYYINSAGHVNYVCYRFMGETNTTRKSSNPKGVVDEVKKSCVDCDAGHLIPHLHVGTSNIRNYFSQNSKLNKGFWRDVEKSLEHKPIGKTVVTIELLYNYDRKSDVFNSLPYPPPTHIQAIIMNDGGNPNNENPYIYEGMNIWNEDTHHFDGNMHIDKYLENIPLGIRALCIK